MDSSQLASPPPLLWRALALLIFLSLAVACARPQTTPMTPAASAPPEVAATPEAPIATTAGEPTAPPLPSATPAPAATAAPAAQPQPRPTHRPSAAVLSPEPPERDLFELASRLRPAPGGPGPRIVNPQPVTYQQGHKDTFWVSDLDEASAHTIQATLGVVSEHAYWYVDDSLDLSTSDLRKAAEAFEAKIHPLLTSAFGDIWSPGVDNDPRLTVLHTPLKGADGYYGSQDEFPRQTHPHSNQREMIYMDGTRLTPGSAYYLAVLAHEFQHAIHWNQDPGEDSWVNEGMSEVAKELTGYPSAFVTAFLRNSDTQLDYWPDEVRATPAHYGAATLFLSYVGQHYGGYAALRELVRHPADSINGVEAYLSAYGVTFLGVFKDWVVANYLDAPEGPLGYPDREVRMLDVDFRIAYGEKEDRLPQFASRYTDLRFKEGDALVSFRGDPQVAQVGTQCHSGRHCWWGNRGDSIDSTLTRAFDLSGLAVATLEFWTWFSVEKDWDYAYVEASTDGGNTWTILEGQHTTAGNPVGNSFGHGFTGSSGGWVREKLDLSSFVGGKVLLRFEYVTDDAVYLDGFVLDDLAIPELGFFDDAELDSGWQAKGFVRTDTVLPQDYLVQVIEERPGGAASVRSIPLDERREGSLLIEGFGSRIEHAVIVVSPTTRGTHQPAHYTLSVSPFSSPP